MRALVCLCALSCSASTVERAAPSTSAATTSSLEQRIRRQMADAPQPRGAVVVGVFDGESSSFVSFGDADADTTFEVGSLTKPMVGVLLADAIERGRMSLSDEASALVSETLPKYEGSPIRIEHLATFTSGLPFMPTNWVDVDRGTYTPAMWRDFLATYELAAAPGSKFAYGNVGFGLLGEALAGSEATTLGAIFRERLFGPLQMNHSWLLDERPASARVAIGHDDSGAPVPLRFDKPIQAGCCAVESTPRDLLAFARAPITSSTPAPLAHAFDLAMTPRRHAEGNYGDRDVGLGFFVRRDEPFYFATGMMRGYRTGVTIDRVHRVATVVLAADAAFPSEVLATDVRQAVLAERAGEKLTTFATLPSDATPASVSWESGLELVGWSAPSEIARGSSVTVRWFYRATRPIRGDWTIFVHGDSGRERVHGDHAPARPTSEWPTGAIVEDRFTIAIPADHPLGPMTIWSGFYHFDRMHVATTDVSDGHDRVRGPEITVK